MSKTQTIAEISAAATAGTVGANVAKYAGAGTVAASMLKLDQISLLVGMLCAVVGVGIGWYYKRKEFRLKELYYKTHGVQLED